jgi:alkylation response protein AidB-like acyl-CoA dehydrogenase
MTTTETPVLDAAAILDRARAAVPVLAAEAEAGEQGRRLTPTAVDALRSTGVFRMAMPASWGGAEVTPPDQVGIVEALARADGSAGWCGAIGAAGGFLTANLADDAGRELYPSVDAVTAGWVVPTGRLRPDGDGYRLSGRWQFGSGCTHADVILGGALVDGPGHEVRIALVPAEVVDVVDNWATTGLAGSGSHDYRIDDVAVPRAHTFAWGEVRRPGPLYAWPGSFTVNLLGVPLGIAGDELATKVLLPEGRPALDEPRVRLAVSRAEALVGSARSYVADVVGRFWATVAAGEEPDRRQRAAVAGLHRHTARSCLAAVELLADALGTTSIRRGCALERHRRDLLTIGQHVTVQDRLLEVLGGLWFADAEVDHPLVDARLF